MSDDASPSSPPRSRLDDDALRELVAAAAAGDLSAENALSIPPEELTRSSSRSSRRRGSSRARRYKRKNRKKRNPGLAKKLAFLTHLLRSLDMLVFAELSALYYMECSMFRFIIRALVQYMYLTPKAETFPFLMPASRGHVFLIAVPNTICILLHLFSSLPSGPDYYRGYMHGGLIVDFVGQKPPHSRLYYILADIVILALQFLMLTVHADRERLRVTLKTFRPMVVPDPATVPRTLEDLDLEERGMPPNMSDVIEADETEEIEMRPLNQERSTEGANEGEGTERSGDRKPSTDSSNDELTSSPLSELLTSGNGILGEYHILHTIRTAAVNFELAAAHSIRNLGYESTLAAIRARRQARLNPDAPSVG